MSLGCFDICFSRQIFLAPSQNSFICVRLVFFCPSADLKVQWQTIILKMSAVQVDTNLIVRFPADIFKTIVCNWTFKWTFGKTTPRLTQINEFWLGAKKICREKHMPKHPKDTPTSLNHHHYFDPKTPLNGGYFQNLFQHFSKNHKNSKRKKCITGLPHWITQTTSQYKKRYRIEIYL